MDDTPVTNATGKSLGEWFAILDGRYARELPHKDIAGLLRDEYDVRGWWGQNVTVEYERHIGRREAGQTQTGEYEATVTRTLPGDMDALLERWMAQLPSGGEGPVFDAVPCSAAPAVSRTEKRRYWRVSLADGSRVTVTISGKPGGAGRTGGPAATLAVTSSKLRTREDRDRWKAFWRRNLASF